ncbi:MAG: hypothetical protein OEM15_09425 [Myxococcales bacterium]|nr:hypothetical protein [Myxococcales bacterium]MDH3483016.1 hypothetical protein [Myxococcales bacterium]
MNDLDLIVAGAMVTLLTFAGAYVAIRHRANESPVDSYEPPRSPSRSSSNQNADVR